MAKANTENTEATESTENKQEAPKKVDIIRGRMPVAMVYAVRFGNLAEGGAAKQRLFATTVGKIYDIEKNRNFSYVTEDTKFTQEQINEAIEWIEQHPEFEAAGAQDVVAYLNSLPIASEEEAKAFEEARKASRGQNTKTKDGEKADGGGGNRRGKDKKQAAEEESAEAVEESADDLLG